MSARNKVYDMIREKEREKIIKIVQITNSKTQLPGQQAYVIVFFFPGIPVWIKSAHWNG